MNAYIDYLVKFANKFNKIAQDKDPLNHLEDPDSIINYTDLIESLKVMFNKYLGLHIDDDIIKQWIKINLTNIDPALLRSLTIDTCGYDWQVRGADQLTAFFADNQNNEFILLLTKTQKIEVHQEYDLIKSIMFAPSGPIPRLWFTIVDLGRSSSMTSTPKEIAHDHWLIEALEELFPGIPMDTIVEFFEDNLSKINKLRSFFDSKIGGRPAYVGGGCDGIAFSLGPNYILKVFRDKVAYEAAFKAKEWLHEKPELAKTEAMIYDVGILGSYGRYQVYYYIMETMQTVKSLDYNVQDNIRNIIRQIVYQINDVNRDGLRLIKKEINDVDFYEKKQT